VRDRVELPPFLLSKRSQRLHSAIELEDAVNSLPSLELGVERIRVPLPADDSAVLAGLVPPTYSVDTTAFAVNGLY
jgi:hypothetical protein